MADAVKSWWISFITILAVRWLVSIAQFQRASRVRGVLAFPAATNVTFIFAIATPLFLVMSILSVMRGEWWFISLIFTILFLMGLFALPATIYVSEAGLREKNWWKKQKIITWSEVAKVKFHQNTLATDIVATNGTTITHSGFHVDRQQFRAELNRHVPQSKIETG